MKTLRFIPTMLLISLLLIGCGSEDVAFDIPVTVLSGSAETDSPLFEQLTAIPNAPEVGIMVGLIDGDQETIALVGNGDLTQDSLYEFGSITKVMTGIALAQLANEEAVTLDGSLNQYLPPELQDEKWEPITLQQVASHVSGLPRMPDNYLSLRTFLSQGNPVSYNDTKLTDAMTSVELAPPGSVREYSNFGFAVLGKVVEQADGRSYEVSIQERIFDAYGMKTATIHEWSGDSIAPPITAAGDAGGYWDFAAMASAGAARGSVLDGMAFLRASMAACERDDAPSRANCLAQESTLSLDGRTTGLAWAHHDSGAIWHNGGTGGYRTFIGFNSAENRGIVLLANSGGASGLDPIAIDWLSANLD